MLARADELLAENGVAAESVVRVDVPGRGAAVDDEGDGALRVEIGPIVPALQSGSLFSGTSGVVVVDAHALRTAEAGAVVELLEAAPGTAVVVFVSSGSVPAILVKAVKNLGRVETVKKLRERDATGWLKDAASERSVQMKADAAAALVQRFGSDVASLGQALDQLATVDGVITRDTVLARFRNRPDEPMWHYADAVANGDVALALRRLADFWIHGHPLQLLGFLENELRQRSLAAAAPDIDTYAAWLARKPTEFPVKKAWRRRNATSDSELAAALDAMRRADETLKTAPIETHRVTMERLTVALCRWYGGKAKRAS